jgi:hypothetical protein
MEAATFRRWNLPLYKVLTYPCDRFPKEKRTCYARSVIATVHAVLADAVQRTIWRGQLSCGPGAAERVTHDFTLGPHPSVMPGMCIAKGAATWTYRAFRVNMATASSPGCFDWFALPHTAVPPAAIDFSHFGFITASSLWNSPLIREWNRIPP